MDKYIIEVSKVIQGEGKLAGIPHILIRTVGCNLRCTFNQTICDTPYASFRPEKAIFDTEEAILRTLELSSGVIRHVMITGGEPTIQDSLPNLIDALFKNRFYITVETSGSGNPLNLGYKGYQYRQPPVHMLSLSPKLSNSYPERGNPHRERHIKLANQIDVMRSMISHSIDYYLKFVISDVEEDALESLSLAKSLGTPLSKIYFMPEGTDRGHLGLIRSDLIFKCIELGVNYTDRLHIIAFGNVRGV